MTRPELDALYTRLDRETAYANLLLILGFTGGLVMFAIGLFAMWSGTPEGVLLAGVGGSVALIALNRTPYEAR
jgi:hypothetical protein